MLALEYTADGERCADFDLYHGRKKISWSDLCGKEYRDYNRQEFAMLCRSKLFEQIEVIDQEFLLEKELKLKKCENK